MDISRSDPVMDGVWRVASVEKVLASPQTMERARSFSSASPLEVTESSGGAVLRTAQSIIGVGTDAYDSTFERIGYTGSEAELNGEWLMVLEKNAPEEGISPPPPPVSSFHSGSVSTTRNAHRISPIAKGRRSSHAIRSSPRIVSASSKAYGAACCLLEVCLPQDVCFAAPPVVRDLATSDAVSAFEAKWQGTDIVDAWLAIPTTLLPSSLNSPESCAQRDGAMHFPSPPDCGVRVFVGVLPDALIPDVSMATYRSRRRRHGAAPTMRLYQVRVAMGKVSWVPRSAVVEASKMSVNELALGPRTVFVAPMSVLPREFDTHGIREGHSVLTFELLVTDPSRIIAVRDIIVPLDRAKDREFETFSFTSRVSPSAVSSPRRISESVRRTIAREVTTQREALKKSLSGVHNAMAGLQQETLSIENELESIVNKAIHEIEEGHAREKDDLVSEIESIRAELKRLKAGTAVVDVEALDRMNANVPEKSIQVTPTIRLAHDASSEKERAIDALNKIFDKVDKNGDGNLNKREFIIAIRKDPSIADALGISDAKVTEGPSRNQFEAFFQAADDNDDRVLSRHEFLSFMATSWESRSSEQVSALDKASGGDEGRSLDVEGSEYAEDGDKVIENTWSGISRRMSFIPARNMAPSEGTLRTRVAVLSETSALMAPVHAVPCCIEECFSVAGVGAILCFKTMTFCGGVALMWEDSQKIGSLKLSECTVQLAGRDQTDFTILHGSSDRMEFRIPGSTQLDAIDQALGVWLKCIKACISNALRREALSCPFRARKRLLDACFQNVGEYMALGRIIRGEDGRGDAAALKALETTSCTFVDVSLVAKNPSWMYLNLSACLLLLEKLRRAWKRSVVLTVPLCHFCRVWGRSKCDTRTPRSAHHLFSIAQRT